VKQTGPAAVINASSLCTSSDSTQPFCRMTRKHDTREFGDEDDDDDESVDGVMEDRLAAEVRPDTILDRIMCIM